MAQRMFVCVWKIANVALRGFYRLVVLPMAWVLGVTPSLVLADENLALIQKVSRSASSLNFVGTYVHQQNGGISTARVYQRTNANGERVTRVQFLDGPAREVIRSAREMRAYLPEQKMVRVYKGPSVRPDFPAVFVADPHWVFDQYDVMRLPGKRVAQQETELLQFKPKDQMRWRVNCWIEKKHSLPLKLQVLDPSGHVLEEYAFSEIKINPSMLPQVAPSFEGMSDWKEVVAPMTPKQLSATVMASAPIAGFRPVGAALVSEPTLKSLEQHVFSDGLAFISVFVGPASNAAPSNPEVSRQGALSMVVRQKGAHTLTAMGEVPAETVLDLLERFSAQTTQ